MEEDFIADLLSFVFVAGVVIVAAIISIVAGAAVDSIGFASTRSCMNLLRKREFPISPGAPINQDAINKTPVFFLVSIQKMPMLADIQKQLRAMRQATEKPITKMKKADILAEIERRTGGEGGSGETAPKKKDKKEKTEKEKVKEKAEKPKPKKVVVAESSSDDDSDSSVEVVKKKKKVSAPPEKTEKSSGFKPEKKSKDVKESSAEDSEKPAKKHKKRIVVEVSDSDSE